MADANKIQGVARRIVEVSKLGTGVVAVVSAMGDSTDELIELAHSVSNSPNLREMDLLLSTGELVSCTLLTMALANLGQEAVSLTGSQAGIHTDTNHGRALIHRVDTSRMQKELEKGRVVVVAGFQGITEDNDITTLGRGGSDTTAVALAAALGADRCEIYTDVDGIYTSDPRIVPEARKLTEIDYDEMLELANYGAKMHPRSIELGGVYNVPIYVSSSFNDTPGTLIHCIPGNANEGEMENRIKATGIACTNNVAKITVRGVPDRPGVAAALFEPLAQSGISVDTIVQNTSEDRTTDISFTVSGTDLPAALSKVEELSTEMGTCELSSEANLAAVSVVGSGMQHTPGYADGDVNIDMITTSEIRISCIIREEQAQEAVKLLHRGFQLDEPNP